MFKSILRRPLLPLLALPLLLAPVPLPAQTGGAPYSIDGRGFSRLQDAVDAIGEGEGTISIAPGYHRDCAGRGTGARSSGRASSGSRGRRRMDLNMRRA